MKILIIALFVVQLFGCDYNPEGKKNRIPDLQYTIDLSSISSKSFVNVAKDYAEIHNLKISGPHESPGKLGVDYVLSIFGEDKFEIIVDTRNGVGYIIFYCSYISPLDGAREQLAKNAKGLFDDYSKQNEINFIKITKLDGSSWHEIEYQTAPNFDELSTCENRSREQ